MLRENPSTEKEKLSAAETIQVEMQESVRRLAFPGVPGEGVKACIRRVAIRSGLGFGQIKRLWYGEWRIVPAHVADQIRNAVEAHERRLDAEFEALKTRRAALYGLTHESSDPEFYRVRAAQNDRPNDEAS